MIFRKEMEGGIRQELAWLHNMWQETDLADCWLKATTAGDYYERVPVELAPGLDVDELILFLSGLDLEDVSVARAPELFCCKPKTALALASSNRADVMALAEQIPAKDPLPDWPAKPAVLSVSTPEAVSLDKVLTYLQREPAFTNAWISVRYRNQHRMQDYAGSPEQVMTLVALHPGKHVMLGYDRMMHYLVIWGPDGMSIPGAEEFLEQP